MRLIGFHSPGSATHFSSVTDNTKLTDVFGRQEAQVSQTNRAMIRVNEHFAKSLKVIPNVSL